MPVRFKVVIKQLICPAVKRSASSDMDMKRERVIVEVKIYEEK